MQLKKRICLLLIMSLVCTLCPTNIMAETNITQEVLTTADGNFEYTIFDNKITITKYCGTDEEVNIPQRIDDKEVTKIGDRAFYGCSELTNVTIQEGVTSIGNLAFDRCSELESITIPEGVTSIGKGTFIGCSELTSIIIPKGVTCIEEYTFHACSGVESITIPEGVTSIENDAFNGCGELTSITIPEGVTSIGKLAFNECNKLTSITIPESVTNIAEYSFHGCSGLTSITIPEGVTRIKDWTFFGCSGLTSVTIPNSVISIEELAFHGCSGLTSITIPESVISLGKGAFEECSGLTSLLIPKGVTSIEYGAFERCSKLTDITLPEDLIGIEDYTFYGCKGLSSIAIPEDVISIGESAFEYCSNLKDVYYEGGEDQWNKIEISSENECLNNATIHFNSFVYDKTDKITNVTQITTKPTKHYYGADTYEKTKEGEIYDAVIEFRSELENYVSALDNEAMNQLGGQDEIVDIKELGKKLRTADEKTNDRYITMYEKTIPSAALDSVYYTLASFLYDNVNESVDLGKIDFSKDSVKIDSDIVNAVRRGMSGGTYTKKYGNYTVTFNTLNMFTSFVGNVSVTGKGKTYDGTITSTVDGTEKVLSIYFDEMSDILKDAYKYALFSILQEYKDVTGISKLSTNSIKDFMYGKIDILQKKGLGDVLSVILNIHDGYLAVKPVIQATTGTKLTSALKNSENIYDTIKDLNFSDKGVKKKAVKKSLKALEKARKKLEIKLFNKIYDKDEEYKEAGFWDEVFNRFEMKCPVDFEVYSDGKLIGYVDSSDNREDYIFYSDGIYIEVMDDVKSLYVPKDKEIQIKFIATDNGTMNYTIERIEDGDKIGRLNYYNVSLQKGGVYVQTIPADVDLQTEKDNLVLDNGTSKLVADEYLRGDDQSAFVTIDVTASKGGIVIGNGRYPKGDSAVLNALAMDDNYVFDGWYNGDELLSVRENYRFTAVRDISLSARFRELDAAIEKDNSGEIKYKLLLDETEIKIKKGEIKKLTATLDPASEENYQVDWESSDTNILQIIDDDKVLALEEGEVTVTATLRNDPTISAICRVIVEKNSEESDGGNVSNGNSGGFHDSSTSGGSVNPDTGNAADKDSSNENTDNTNTVELKAGDKVTVGNTLYTIIDVEKKEVSYTRTESKATKLKVPATVNIAGQKYKVIKVADNAFIKNKKITQIVIGKNVTEIGKKAFKGCKNLKRLIVPANVKSIGAYAFSGTEKLTVLTITTEKLTKKDVKNALKGSSIKSIKLKGDARKVYKKYCAYLKKSNSGRNIEIRR